MDEAKILAALADLDPDREDFLMLLAGVTPRQMADLDKVHVNTVTGRLRPYVQAIPGLIDLHKSQIPDRPGMHLREQWRRRHDELVAFCTEYGDLPSSVGTRPGEKALGIWLGRQRKANRDGKLAESQLRLLDQVSGWSEGRMRLAYLTRHAEYLDKLVVFYRSHERWPRSFAGDEEERDVGKWLRHRRIAARQGALDEALAAELNGRVPGWRGRVNRPRPKAGAEGQN